MAVRYTPVVRRFREDSSIVDWGSHMLCAFAAATIALVPQLPAHRVTGYASGISRTSDVQMINLFGNTGAQDHATEPLRPLRCTRACVL